MKIKIIEDPFLVSNWYEDDVFHSFSNVLQQERVITIPLDSGDEEDLIIITRLVDYISMKKYKLYK